MKILNEEYKELIQEEKGSGRFEGWEVFDNQYQSSGRHTEYWTALIISSDGRFYQGEYQTSVKDSMDWIECNWQKEFTLVEVVPVRKTIVQTNYLPKYDKDGKLKEYESDENCKGSLREGPKDSPGSALGENKKQ